MSSDSSTFSARDDFIVSMPRRLAAIVFADIAAFSRMMSVDEYKTVRQVTSLRRNIIEPTANKFDGRLIKSMGDGFLLEFTSAVNAVCFSIDVQEQLQRSMEHSSGYEGVMLRVGINLGDVIYDRDDIYGDGVNIAARLEAMCEPGGICVSEKVHEEAKRAVPFVSEDLGLLSLKNIDQPVRAWKIAGGSPQRHRVARTSVVGLERPKVAFVPFDADRSDPEQRQFADGVAEDIITELARFRLLSVVGSSSSFALSQQGLSDTEVGAKLGASYVVKGSIRRSSEKVRVGVQLLDVGSGDHVWSERFDRAINNVFELQDEISRVIASHLFRNVEVDGTVKAKRKKPGSVVAYDMVLKGMDHHQRWTPEDNEIATAYFREAIDVDPMYAEAYVWMSLTYQYRHSFDLSGDTLGAAIDFARKAYELDKTSARAAGILASTRLLARDFSEAERLYRVAENLNPNDPHITAMAALMYAYIGDHRESGKMFERAIALNPYPPIWYREHQAILAFASGRYEQAVASLQTEPLFGIDAAYVVSCLGHLGRGNEAKEWLSSHANLTRSVPVSKLARAEPFLHVEDTERLMDGIQKAGFQDD